MGKIIACVNEKGGVAKTTTIKNLSIGLASAGKKVLVVDIDPSANLTTSLGINNKQEKTTILDILKLSKECEDIPKDFGIIHQAEGIDVIASTDSLHEFESELICAFQREVVLRRYLMEIRSEYDYIFIDCPAGLGIFVTNALFSADAVIIPVQPQFLGAGAMQNLFQYIARVRKMNGTKTKPEIMGILFTMVRINTTNDKTLMNFFRNSYEDKINIFNTYIPNSVKFCEADGEGESIYKYAGKSSSAMIHSELVTEFLEMEKEKNDQ